MSTVRYTGIQVRGERISGIDDTIVREERFTLVLNGTRFLDLVASRENLQELGAGFVLCQGLSRSVEAVSVEGNEIRVSAPLEESCEREIETTGTVGFICRPPEPVPSGCTITIPDVFAITREIVTDLWRQTGGVHCSVLAKDGEILFRASDVGRHNTVDKVIGYGVLNGIDLSGCIVGCTGRQPRDMVIKYANAGIPIVISRAASTDRGIATAEELGITLICFSRDERFTVYTHPWRVRGVGPEDRPR
jgi:FdhD protein